ncbi:hypothetical protein MMC20_007559 [Loxospora ochrophaea]|nr:hypothetical protein [Loxospora ochrophaea]
MEDKSRGGEKDGADQEHQAIHDQGGRHKEAEAELPAKQNSGKEVANEVDSAREHVRLGKRSAEDEVEDEDEVIEGVQNGYLYYRYKSKPKKPKNVGVNRGDLTKEDGHNKTQEDSRHSTNQSTVDTTSTLIPSPDRSHGVAIPGLFCNTDSHEQSTRTPEHSPSENDDISSPIGEERTATEVVTVTEMISPANHLPTVKDPSTEDTASSKLDPDHNDSGAYMPSSPKSLFNGSNEPGTMRLANNIPVLLSSENTQGRIYHVSDRALHLRVGWNQTQTIPKEGTVIAHEVIVPLPNERTTVHVIRAPNGQPNLVLDSVYSADIVRGHNGVPYLVVDGVVYTPLPKDQAAQEAASGELIGTHDGSTEQNLDDDLPANVRRAFDQAPRLVVDGVVYSPPPQKQSFSENPTGILPGTSPLPSYRGLPPRTTLIPPHVYSSLQASHDSNHRDHKHSISRAEATRAPGYGTRRFFEYVSSFLQDNKSTSRLPSDLIYQFYGKPMGGPPLERDATLPLHRDRTVPRVGRTSKDITIFDIIKRAFDNVQTSASGSASDSEPQLEQNLPEGYTYVGVLERGPRTTEREEVSRILLERIYRYTIYDPPVEDVSENEAPSFPNMPQRRDSSHIPFAESRENLASDEPARPSSQDETIDVLTDNPEHVEDTVQQSLRLSPDASRFLGTTNLAEATNTPDENLPKFDDLSQKQNNSLLARDPPGSSDTLIDPSNETLLSTPIVSQPHNPDAQDEDPSNETLVNTPAISQQHNPKTSDQKLPFSSSSSSPSTQNQAEPPEPPNPTSHPPPSFPSTLPCQICHKQTTLSDALSSLSATRSGIHWNHHFSTCNPCAAALTAAHPQGLSTCACQNAYADENVLQRWRCEDCYGEGIREGSVRAAATVDRLWRTHKTADGRVVVDEEDGEGEGEGAAEDKEKGGGKHANDGGKSKGKKRKRRKVPACPREGCAGRRYRQQRQVYICLVCGGVVVLIGDGPDWLNTTGAK